MKYFMFILGIIFLVFLWCLTVYCIEHFKELAYGWLFIADIALSFFWGLVIAENLD